PATPRGYIDRRLRGEERRSVQLYRSARGPGQARDAAEGHRLSGTGRTEERRHSVARSELRLEAEPCERERYGDLHTHHREPLPTRVRRTRIAPVTIERTNANRCASAKRNPCTAS